MSEPRNAPTWRLVLVDEQGTMIDSVETTEHDLRQAQTKSLGALSLLQEFVFPSSCERPEAGTGSTVREVE